MKVILSVHDEGFPRNVPGGCAIYVSHITTDMFCLSQSHYRSYLVRDFSLEVYEKVTR
jgi:hypothetical protein